MCVVRKSPDQAHNFDPFCCCNEVRAFPCRLLIVQSDFSFMTPVSSKIPCPNCKHCGATMALVGKLPSIGTHPEVRVFRCYGCNQVLSEEV
jgi:hypothetical protein